MAIYVDQLINYGQAPEKGGERYFGNGKASCHMATDGEPEELHVFAEKIGLRRSWYQGGRLGHYDLTPSKRRLAVQNGAVEVTSTELAHLCWLKEAKGE